MYVDGLGKSSVYASISFEMRETPFFFRFFFFSVLPTHIELAYFFCAVRNFVPISFLRQLSSLMQHTLEK